MTRVFGLDKATQSRPVVKTISFWKTDNTSSVKCSTRTQSFTGAMSRKLLAGALPLGHGAGAPGQRRGAWARGQQCRHACTGCGRAEARASLSEVLESKKVK